MLESVIAQFKTYLVKPPYNFLSDLQLRFVNLQGKNLTKQIDTIQLNHKSMIKSERKFILRSL
jgi:hypothetical protein